MDDSRIINHYFPDANESQRLQFEALGNLYREWNTRINVVSRKDIDNLYLHHVLHSLAIARFLGNPTKDTVFVDVGTGGGFPAIPLAILFPDCNFHLVDRIAKKLRVAEEIGRNIGLSNLTFKHGDMSECTVMADYALSRAAMPLNVLVKIVRKNISSKQKNSLNNGVICLKGGDLSAESEGVNFPIIEVPVTDYFYEPFFDGKKVVYVPIINNKK